MSVSDQLGASKDALPAVVHVTTAHRADDVRIFERECRSLAASGLYRVHLAAAGTIPADAGVSLIPLTPAPKGRAERFRSSPRKGFALTRTVAADLWHFHDPELLPVAVKLARSGHRVIWDAHEDYIAQLGESAAKSWVPGPARGAVRAGTRMLLDQVDRHATGIIAATHTIAAGYANRRTVVVGNEARLELFANCQPDFGSRRVLFTGSPGPGHLFREVVEAVASIPNASLAVAGKEPDPATWAHAQGVLGPRLTHLGWLNRQGIVDAIGSSSVGMSTYADLPTHAETSPNKLFEFGAAGLPVVASPTPSNATHLSNSRGGVVARGFSSRQLAEALSVLLSDEQAWGRASAAGRAWATREGSWSASEQRLLGLYSAVFRLGEMQ
jgi:glycosyltransferase involved in cell wall biosynthesis